MRPFWLLGLVLAAALSLTQIAEASAYVTFSDSVITPCHPPIAHPLGTAYQVTWVDACSTLDTFYNPRLRTDLVQTDGSVIFIAWGERAIRRDSQDSPDRNVGFAPTDSILFRPGGWGYIISGPQLGGPEGDRWIPWVGPPAAGVAWNAVINPTGQELLDAGVATRRIPSVQPCCPQPPPPPCCPPPPGPAAWPTNQWEAANTFGGTWDRWERNSQGGWHLREGNAVTVYPRGFLGEGFLGSDCFAFTIPVSIQGGTLWNEPGTWQSAQNLRNKMPSWCRTIT